MKSSSFWLGTAIVKISEEMKMICGVGDGGDICGAVPLKLMMRARVDVVYAATIR